LAGLGIRKDAEVGPRFQPQIIRLAGMVARRIEILLGMRRCLKQSSIDVRGSRITFDVWGTERGTSVVAGPVVILH